MYIYTYTCIYCIYINKNALQFLMVLKETVNILYYTKIQYTILNLSSPQIMYYLYVYKTM